MTTLRDAMLDDLIAHGVLLTTPEDRERYVDAMIAGSTIDGTEVAVTAGEWREVIAWLDAIMDGQPGRLAATLVSAMKTPKVWQDLVRGAARWGEIHRAKETKKDAMPSHYAPKSNYAGTCAHGRRPSEWCDECARRETASMRTL